MEDQDKNEPTMVIFRRWRDGGTLIAIFPQIHAGGGLCQMYESVGQHGGGDYSGVMAQTVPALYNEPDVLTLRAELEGIGYMLTPRQRISWNTVGSKS